MFGSTGYGNSFNSPSSQGKRQGGGFLGAGASPSAGGNEGQNRINCIFPASISQLLKIEEVEGKMMHHDREISQVRLLGTIVNPRTESNRNIYTLQDMTGDIEIIQFLDADNPGDLPQMELIRDNNWVVVLGSLKNFQGKRSVTAFRIQQVNDANEITTHILECIDANLYFRKLKQGGTSGVSSSLEAMQVDSGRGGMPGAYANSGLNALQQQLVMSIGACHDERGLSIHDMISTLSGQYKERDIRSAVDFLVQEGHIYSSVDDEHFLTTS